MRLDAFGCPDVPGNNRRPSPGLKNRRALGPDACGMIGTTVGLASLSEPHHALFIGHQPGCWSRTRRLYGPSPTVRMILVIDVKKMEVSCNLGRSMKVSTGSSVDLCNRSTCPLLHSARISEANPGNGASESLIRIVYGVQFVLGSAASIFMRSERCSTEDSLTRQSWACLPPRPTSSQLPHLQAYRLQRKSDFSFLSDN